MTRSSTTLRSVRDSFVVPLCVTEAFESGRCSGSVVAVVGRFLCLVEAAVRRGSATLAVREGGAVDMIRINQVIRFHWGIINSLRFVSSTVIPSVYVVY